MSSSKTRTTTGTGRNKETAATGAKPARARTPRVPPPPGARSAAAKIERSDPADAIAQQGTAPADPEAQDAQPMNKRELLNKVVARADVKKKFAKPTIEAVLAILGETLAEGREMNLQPLGKVKLNRTQESEKARVIVTKIRQNKAATGEAPKPDTGTTTDTVESPVESVAESSTETED